MAPKKKPKSQLSKSAKYYRDNPKARKKKAATDKKVNAKPDQKAKRRELGKVNYKHDKTKGKASRAGKDASHTKKGIVYKSASANRGSTSDSKGDVKSRGRKNKSKGTRKAKRS